MILRKTPLLAAVLALSAAMSLSLSAAGIKGSTLEDKGYNEAGQGTADPRTCGIVTETQYLITEFCTDHGLKNEAMTGILSQDPEDTKAAAALWEAEVQALFEEKLQNSSEADRPAVMAENDAFKTYAQDYRSALVNRWPEDEELVDLAMMYLYQDQAVLMCGPAALSMTAEHAEGQGY